MKCVCSSLYEENALILVLYWRLFHITVFLVISACQLSKSLQRTKFKVHFQEAAMCTRVPLCVGSTTLYSWRYLPFL